MIIWSWNCPFVVVLRGNKNGDPPFLFVFFYSPWLHNNYIYENEEINEMNYFMYFTSIISILYIVIWPCLKRTENKQIQEFDWLQSILTAV